MYNVVGPTLVAMTTKFGQIWAIFSTKSHISQLVCQIDRICLGLPGETTGGLIFVAMATTFALGAESSRLPACSFLSFFLVIKITRKRLDRFA